ncbi:GcrA family cell cycle regulator [Sandaracinobacteroides sp. A072]|uniref:GcrA family cell cycle regulator n=1 Tax=Sandaracinobacteroides sp. A072 TaxID=3461146 RepID=UPI00404226E0
MAWTDERIALLKQYWEEGRSASQIAELLGDGLSRNAVIGKAHRLGLASRPSPLKTGDQKGAAKPARSRTAKPATEKAAGPEAEPQAPAAQAGKADAPGTDTPAGKATTSAKATGKTGGAAPASKADTAEAGHAPATRETSPETVVAKVAATEKAAVKRPVETAPPVARAARVEPGHADIPELPGAIPRSSRARTGRAKGGKISLLDLNDRICKWPIGHPDEPDFHFCGKPVNPGFPYCGEHCLVAYQAQMPRGSRPPGPSRPFGPNLPRPR